VLRDDVSKSGEPSRIAHTRRLISASRRDAGPNPPAIEHATPAKASRIRTNPPPPAQTRQPSHAARVARPARVRPAALR